MRSSIRKTAALLIACCMLFAFAGCSIGKQKGPATTLNIYAPVDGILAFAGLPDKFTNATDGKVAIKLNYDDSLMHAAKIEAGYDCDIYITNDIIGMNWLDEEFIGVVYEEGEREGQEANPNHNNKIYSLYRKDVLKLAVKNEDGEDSEMIFTVAIVRGTKHLDECKQFLEFMYSDDAKELYKVGGYEVIEEE